jgi:hypothetical protein
MFMNTSSGEDFHVALDERVTVRMEVIVNEGEGV